MLPKFEEEKFSYEDYDKFLALASKLTRFLVKCGLVYEAKVAGTLLNNIAAKIKSHLGE